jgi:DNA-binding beta-propeller fold protein YncE
MQLLSKMSSTLGLVLTLCLLSAAQGQDQRSLALEQTIVLPNVQGGFNHMTVDAQRHRLFVAAPANKTLEVVDLSSGKPQRSLEGERPAAARYAPEFDQLYVPRGQSLYIYDGKTLGLITSIDLQSILDELHYDARAKELYVGVMNVDKPGIAIISIPDGKLRAKISLPGKPQGITFEQNGRRIFANVPSMKQIAVVDRERRVLLTPWSLQDIQGNSPIGLDEAHHRLFVGARNPAELLIINTENGKTVATVPISSDADDLFYDDANKRVYISCGEGFVDVIEQLDADRYRMQKRIRTVAGARTSTFSAVLNAFYLGVPQHGGEPAKILVFNAAK